MSVIAFDGRTLASDTGASSPSGTLNRMLKIAAVANVVERPFIGSPGFVIVGVVGHPQGVAMVQEFLAGSADTLDLGFGDDASEAIMVSNRGAWLWNGKRPTALVAGAYAAIGIGAKAALGAMYAGANAHRACEIACAISDGCEPPIQSFTLPAEVEEPPELHEVQEEPTRPIPKPNKTKKRRGQ